MTESKQPLVEHLRELRIAIIRSLIAIGIFMVATLFFSKEIFHLLQKPLLKVMPNGSASSFIVTSPLEALMTYIEVSLLTGVFLSAPFVFYQLWGFIAPGLKKNEKKLALSFTFFASFFFIGGALFGYFVIFPVGFPFFVSALNGTGIQFLPKMDDYFSFISKMLLTFGLIFELPLILIALAKIGLVQLEMLTKARRYVVVALFLIAGVLTPGPDVLSQVLLGVPLYLLYEFSILAIRFIVPIQK